MELHQAADRFLALVPQNPAEARDSVHQALQVLTEDPTMRWSCLALIAAGVALAGSRRAAATTLSVLAVGVTSFVWLRVNRAHEGVILLEFSPQHGLTEADLLVPAVIGIAGSVWLLSRRRLRTTVTRVRSSVQTSSSS